MKNKKARLYVNKFKSNYVNYLRYIKQGNGQIIFDIEYKPEPAPRIIHIDCKVETKILQNLKPESK